MSAPVSCKSHTMNSSTASHETEQPVASGAGARAAVPSPADPYQVLDELMALVEALCPRWPERGTTVDSGEMRL